MSERVNGHGGGSIGWSMDRRHFLKLGGSGLAGIALLGVAACGGQEQQQGGGPINLTFSLWQDSSGRVQELVDRFNQTSEGRIRVDYRPLSPDVNQQFAQLLTQFQGGGGDIETIGGASEWVAQFAYNEWIVPLSERFDEDAQSQYLDGRLQAINFEDQVWGVPWYTDAGLLYYRKDLLEESGFSEPPRTWDELKEMALKIKQDAGLQNGYVFQGADYEGGVVNATEFIRTSGGNLVDPEDPSRVVIDSPEAVRGLSLERSMITEGVAPEGVVSFKEPESQGAFLRGEAAFHRNWPYLYGLSADPEQSEVEQAQLGIAQLPVAEEGLQSTSTAAGWNFMINAAHQDQEDACWEFISFMVAPEQQRWLLREGGFLPALKDLYEDEELAEEVPLLALSRDAVLNSRPQPVSPFYQDMSIEMAQQFNQSLNSEIEPEEAVEALQARMTEIIEEG